MFILRFLRNYTIPTTRFNMSSATDAYPHLSNHLRSIVAKHLPKASPEVDPSTLSNYQNFSVKHTVLDLKVLFEEKKLHGSILLKLLPLYNTDKIVLDSSYLKVDKVLVNGTEKDFQIGDRIEPLGAPLSINHDVVKDTQLEVQIFYETTDNCTALQWLDPAQTDGKSHAYLFSQCEPIHARSFFPCFDTPSIKSTFTYYFDSPLNTLTSGLLKDKKGSVYHFEQGVPIPSYLVSIASGEIVDAEIGPRSKVYSEPSFIDACKWEFENDTEKFIRTAENIVFPYEWIDYDVLILPSSMPFGGMEHPNCTFATPTLISGDRENVDVIAHELAHSWSGNLVTNCSFEHFWLNEGWTVYLERRIQGQIHGEPFRHFSAIIGWNDLKNSILSMGESAKRYSTLVQDLKDGTDPDDSFSTVPYEKGFNLLFHLEQKLGSTAKFDPFIKHYFSKYKYTSLDTYQFLDTLYAFYKDEHDLLDTIDWDTWLFKPGMPPMPHFKTDLVDECYTLAEKWVHSTKTCPDKLRSLFSCEDISSFGANQNGVFLDKLVDYEGVEGFTWKNESGHEAIKVMSEVYEKYPNSHNAEVLFRWYRLLVSAEVKSAYVQLAQWLGTVGRMKFVRPSYKMLSLVDRELAVETFRKNEMIYHPICRAMVKKDLGL